MKAVRSTAIMSEDNEIADKEKQALFRHPEIRDATFELTSL